MVISEGKLGAVINDQVSFMFTLESLLFSVKATV